MFFAVKNPFGKVVSVLLLVALASSLALHTTPARAAGNIYYVSTSGNDANPGTSSSPWRSLAKAAATAAAGDIVNVRGGTYYETLSPARSGTSAAKITFKSYPGETAVINGGGSRYGINFSSKSYLRFEGFEITSSTKGLYSDGSNTGNEFIGNSVHHNSGSGVHWRSESYGLIENNQIYNNGEGLVMTYADHNTARHNTIYMNTVDGIYVDYSQYNTVDHNVVRDHVWSSASHSDAMQFWQSPNNTITNNLVYRTVAYQNSGSQGIFVSYSAGSVIKNNVVSQSEAYNFNVLNSPGSVLVNNTSYQGRWGAYYIKQGSTNVILRNNIAFESGDVMNVTADAQTGFNSDYNIFYGSAASPIKWGSAWYSLSAFKGFGHDAHSKAVDPKFVNPSGYDFRLQSSSPAIDAGTSDSALATDLDGNARSDVSTVANTGGGVYPYYDIGAYEYGGSAPPPPPPPPPAPTLSRVAITPASATLTTGQSTAFTAQAFDTADTAMSATYTWTANGGTLSASAGGKSVV